jgi:hypothetical protein
LFDVIFPAKKRVEIEHTYTMDATFDSMNTHYVSYVTRTGSTWAGPIGSAKFRQLFRYVDAPAVFPAFLEPACELLAGVMVENIDVQLALLAESGEGQIAAAEVADDGGDRVSAEREV